MRIWSALPLLVIGTVLGAMRKVDMEYLRKRGIVRLLVDVLDSNKIPDDTDIVINGCMYPILFKLEEVVSTGDNNFDDDNLLDEEDTQGGSRRGSRDARCDPTRIRKWHR